jgi:hypothetical protein
MRKFGSLVDYQRVKKSMLYVYLRELSAHSEVENAGKISPETGGAGEHPIVR